MNNHAEGQVHKPERDVRRRIRRRLALIIAAALGISFLATSALLIWKAEQARRTEMERLMTVSVTLSHALDREAAGSRSLLIGLSSSLALRSGDLERFDAQLKTTPVPEGIWFVLLDTERVLLNTLLPFGTSNLPRIADYGRTPSDVARLDARGFTVTGRIYGVIAKVIAVAVNLKVAGPDGQMKYILTTVLSDKRLKTILEERRDALASTSAIYDRDMKGVISLEDGQQVIAPSVPEALVSEMARATQPNASGLVEGLDDRGVPIAIAFARSEFTEWTAAATIPLARLNGPLRETLQHLAGAAILLALAGILALKLMTREVEAPIDTLETSVAEAHQTVGTLTQRLLHLQEDEHRRMAQELHDSTAQHLVGALLGVMSLGPKLTTDRAGNAIVTDIKTSIDRALTELRTFSFLLHPPDLVTRGLAAALEDFVHGFARRTKLEEEVAVDPHVDAQPFELQLALLRITQEALTNTHRHAGATHVIVRLSVTASLVTLTIEDDGRGFEAASPVSSTTQDRHGVGIPGMRSRLAPFGGKLEIDSTSKGTTVRATIPLADSVIVRA